MQIKLYINVKNAIRLQQIVVEVSRHIKDGVEKKRFRLLLMTNMCTSKKK